MFLCKALSFASPLLTTNKVLCLQAARATYLSLYRPSALLSQPEHIHLRLAFAVGQKLLLSSVVSWPV